MDPEVTTLILQVLTVLDFSFSLTHRAVYQSVNLIFLYLSHYLAYYQHEQNLYEESRILLEA